jgi:hypothetical protein
MNVPIVPTELTESQRVAAAANGQNANCLTKHRRRRAKWVGLHEALALLVEAQRLAADNAGSAEHVDALSGAGT